MLLELTWHSHNQLLPTHFLKLGSALLVEPKSSVKSSTRSIKFLLCIESRSIRWQKSRFFWNQRKSCGNFQNIRNLIMKRVLD